MGIYTIWVQIDTDVDSAVNLDRDDMLDILHNIRRDDIVDFVDDKDIAVKLVKDA